MKIKCTECEYLIMHHRSEGIYSSYGRGEYYCEHPVSRRLLETKQAVLCVLGQMNVRQNQQ